MMLSNTPRFCQPMVDGECIAYGKVPELELQGVFVRLMQGEALDYLMPPRSEVLRERECWWGEGMAG